MNSSKIAQDLSRKNYYLTQVGDNPIEVFAKKKKYGYQVMKVKDTNYLIFTIRKENLLEEKDCLLKQQKEAISNSLNFTEELASYFQEKFNEFGVSNEEDLKLKVTESIVEKIYDFCKTDVKNLGYYDLTFLQIETFDELVTQATVFFPEEDRPFKKISQLADEVSLMVEKRLSDEFGEFKEDVALEWREENYHNAKDFLQAVRVKRLI